MDSKISERIVLDIVTDLKTRLMVVPLRSENIGDVRGAIKSYHTKLFPTWGAVDVKALEVEVRGNKCRLADPLPIEHLFWRASRASLFAELTPLSSSTLEVPPMPNLAGAAEPIIVSRHESRQNPAERAPSPQRRALTAEPCSPDLGASRCSNPRKLGVDDRIVDGRHGCGCKSGVVERLLKRGMDVHESPCAAGERQVLAQCATVAVSEPATKKPCADKGHPVLEHLGPETGVSAENHSMRKSPLVAESAARFASPVMPDSGEQLPLRKPSLPEFLKQSARSLIKEGLENASAGGSGSLKHTGRSLTKVGQENASAGGPGSLKQSGRSRIKECPENASSSQAGSRSRSETDHPVAKCLPVEPGLECFQPVEDGSRKTLKDLGTNHESSSRETSRSSQSGQPLADNLDEEPDLATLKPDSEDIERNSPATESSPESSRSHSGTRTGSQGEIAVKVEVDGLATPERRVPFGGRQNLNGSLEINNKSKDSNRRDSDLSAGSSHNEDSGGEGAELQGNHSSSSSDDSSAESDGEVDSKTLRPSEGSDRNNSDQTTSDGDSSLQASEGSESENIESSSDESDQIPPTDLTTPKDGNGAARSIGRRRSGAPVDPKYQHLLDSLNGFDELVSLSQLKSKVTSGFQQESHVASQDDSLSMDLVPDIQGGDLNGTSDIPEVQKDLLNAEPVEKFGEASLLLAVQEELISSGGGTTEKTLELEEVPPQVKSEDSHQVRAALQLARMSTPNRVDSNFETPRKKRKRRKGISSPAEAMGDTQSKDLPDDSNQLKEFPISVVGNLLHDEASRLLSSDGNVPVAEGFGNVLPSLEANQVITKSGSVTADENLIGIQFDEEVASDADIGRKKQRKRSRKVSVSNAEMPGKDITGHMKSGEDEPSQSYLDRPDSACDEAGNKENSGKTTSFEYRDLRQRRNLASDHNAVEKIMSGLQRDELAKNLSRNETEGAEEEPVGLQEQQILTGWVCALCNPSVPFARHAALLSHIRKAHNLVKRDIPRELVQKIEVENSSRSKKQPKEYPVVLNEDKETDVADKIEQLDYPTVLGSNDDQPTDRPRNDGQNEKETSLKSKRKDPKSLGSSVEGRNSEGDILEEPLDDEDLVATQQSSKVVPNTEQIDIVGKAAKKELRKKKLQDGVSWPTKEVSDAKASEKMTVNAKSTKTLDGKTGGGSKRKANGGLQTDQNCQSSTRCPYDCGREFLKKTSAYYRHLKSCVLGRAPNFA